LITLATFKRVASAVVIAGSLAYAANAGATSVARADTEDLAHIADLIVVGEVENVVTKTEAMSPTIPDQIVRTHNAVRVIETWKGDAKTGDVIDVADVGGIGADGVAYAMDGVCGYKVGERVLLFLQPRKNVGGEWLTLGVFLGKYSLVANGEGGWILTRLRWKIEERGKKFDIRKIPAENLRVSPETDFVAFSNKVKSVVDADRAAGIDGKWLPKYDHMGVGR